MEEEEEVEEEEEEWNPEGGLMEQGYRSFWIRSHMETIAGRQDLANLIDYVPSHNCTIN